MIGKFKYALVGNHASSSGFSSAATLTIPGGDCDAVAIQAIGQNIRYTMDGTTPTATVGFQITAGDSDIIPISSGTTITLIEEAATATVQYQFLRLVEGTR